MLVVGTLSNVKEERQAVWGLGVGGEGGNILLS